MGDFLSGFGDAGIAGIKTWGQKGFKNRGKEKRNDGSVRKWTKNSATKTTRVAETATRVITIRFPSQSESTGSAVNPGAGRQVRFVDALCVQCPEACFG
jgi:hypothetical protein